MPKLIYLTKTFYCDYEDCDEIEQKENRPYVRVQIVIDGVIWAIPLRSGIKHKYAIWTDRKNNCGLDLSKAVAVLKPKKYIEKSKTPHIRENEHNVLKRINDSWIKEKFCSYIKAYKKAKEHPSAEHNRKILEYSALQYFEKCL